VRPSAANDVLMRPVGDSDGDSLVARPAQPFAERKTEMLEPESAARSEASLEQAASAQRIRPACGDARGDWFARLGSPPELAQLAGASREEMPAAA